MDRGLQPQGLGTPPRQSCAAVSIAAICCAVDAWHVLMLRQAPWLLMIETDYVWLKPVAAPPAESAQPSLAFPFGYIQPTAGGISGVMRKMYPQEKGPLSDVPNSGPAPVLMRWQELFKVQP